MIRARISLFPKNEKVLDYDIETVSAGFADPQWVPQRVTVIAWSWVGSRKIEHATRLEGPEEMFGRFLEAYNAADVGTGHNLIRFDQPVLNADMIRTGMGVLPAKLIRDTMRLPKTKGLKKGQDNLGSLLGTRSKKMPLDWQGWDDGYQWDALIAGQKVTWKVPIDRCVSDVRQHKQLLARLQEEGLLKPDIWWKPL